MQTRTKCFSKGGGMKTKRVKIGLATAVLLITMTGAAWAGNGFHKRLNTQAGKIDNGLKSGSLTYKEHLRLNKEQFHIQQARNRALSDGKLTRKERLRLNRMQDDAARHISQANHNKYRQSHRKKAYHAKYRRNPSFKNTYTGCTTNPHRSRPSFVNSNRHDQWGVSMFYRDDRH
jgi:hypothetical protein